jgi:hypothetical protein
METKVSYIARLPTPNESIKEWQKEMTRLLPKELDLIHWPAPCWSSAKAICV